MVTGNAFRLAGGQDEGVTRGFFAGARALVVDGALDALLLSVTDRHDLVSGWPVDRCDVIILAGEGEKTAAGIEWRQLCRRAGYLAPRRVLIDSDDEACLTASRQVAWLKAALDDGSAQVMSRTGMLDTVMDPLTGGAT
jgi:hypothetical protein